MSSIKHLYKKHGNPEAESKRGQIAITDKDIQEIPSIVKDYNYIVFGTLSQQKLKGIVYVKTLQDGTTYFVEEARTGKNTLSATTMWKHKNIEINEEKIRRAVRDNATSKKESLSPNVQDDTANAVIIANPNKNVNNNKKYPHSTRLF